MCSHEKLQACWDTYQVLFRTCVKARDLTVANPTEFVGKFGLPFLGEKGDNRTRAKQYFDELTDRIHEDLIVALVATFEHVAFEHLKNALGTVKAIVHERYNQHQPFGPYRDRLVKNTDEDMKDLGDIHRITENIMPLELRKKFREVIQERNRIAHGRRFGVKTQLTPPQILGILDDVLRELTVKQ